MNRVNNECYVYRSYVGDDFEGWRFKTGFMLKLCV